MIRERGDAVFGWGWFPTDEKYRWVCKYWPVTVGAAVRSQRRCRRPLTWWAGVRDWTRGRHWDRRSRYGER